MSYIDIRDLTFSYTGKRIILDHIHLSIERGEWIAILGHNGSGKSTLAKTMVGLLEPSQGSIAIDDLTLTPDTLYDIRKKIGIVFQNPDNQFVGVTVKDDIAFGMENLAVRREEMLVKIAFYAEKVGMSDFLAKEPNTLSGGQKQRVAIAGILAMQTEIMIFDEATSMLDPFARKDLMAYIRTLHDEGITIIMITHDMEEALYADRLVILKEGAITLDGPKAVILSDAQAITDARLELPMALKIAGGLTVDNDKMKAVKTFLWESISAK
jgi:energy-coupling factor transport system ATP-binding protein